MRFSVPFEVKLKVLTQEGEPLNVTISISPPEGTGQHRQTNPRQPGRREKFGPSGHSTFEALNAATALAPEEE